MSTLRSSAGLAALALIAGLSQAPAKAQANALQELSRQMIGSSFDTSSSPTTLPGSPSLVQSGSESSGRVVGDLVDQEIRRRPTATRPVAAKNAPKTVQLLVPVRTGLEFAQIEPLVPGAKILEMNGGVFVLVSESAQALPAYQRGRQLQAKLGVAFQLAYSDGHPDLNLAWMSAVHADVASAPKPESPQQVAAVKPPAEPVKPGTAKDLGLLVLQAPWGHQATAAAPAQPPTSRQPAPDSRVLNNKAAIASSTKATPAVPKQADTQPPLLAAAASQPVVAAQPQPVAVKAPVAQPASTRSLRDSLAELRAMRQAPAMPEPVASAQPAPPVAGAVPPAPDSRVLNNKAAIASSTKATPAVPKQADTQPPLLAAAASQPVVAAQPQPVAVKAPVAQPASTRSLRDSLAELRAMRQAPAMPEPVTSAQPAQPAPPARSASLVQAVAILPPQVGQVPLLSSRFMAVNQELAYVYVKLRDVVEVASLNHVAPVAAVHDRDGQLLARVGVYTNTPVGNRLLNQQTHILRQQGYDLELVAGSNWQASATKG